VACLAEAYRKRQYRAHFASKISDADMENSETLVWLEFAEACRYVSCDVRKKLEAKNIEVGRLLGYMRENPGRFGVKQLQQAVSSGR
jgi:four helix bundle protein